MQDQNSSSQSWGSPERLALSAASCGFVLSFILGAAYRSADLHGAVQLQNFLETCFAFLWPSSVLLLGAKTAQGRAILFLLSAFLNAGYFTFLSVAGYALFEKITSRTLLQRPAASNVHRKDPATRMADHMSVTRPVA